MDVATSAAGCCIVEGVFDSREVAAMRERISRALGEAPRVGDVTGHALCGDIRVDLWRYPDIYRSLFTPRMLSALRQLSQGWPDDGHFVITPEHAFHRNGFGTWHKDSDAQERAGLNFHWYPGYAIVQLAVYLQDASAEFGGGLSVIPGSHKIPNPFGLLQQPELRELWYADKQRTVIPSAAGDLVCFDTKLDHSATRNHSGAAPPYGEKLALFFSIGPRDASAATFAAFLRGRPDYPHLAGYRIPPELEELGRTNNFSFAL